MILPCSDFWSKVAHGYVHPLLRDLFPHVDYLDGRFVDGHPCHDKQLDNHARYIMSHEMLWRRSVFGMAFAFNRLLQSCIDACSVSEFQSCLTDIVRVQCELGNDNWANHFDAELNCVDEGRYSSILFPMS